MTVGKVQEDLPNRNIEVRRIQGTCRRLYHGDNAKYKKSINSVSPIHQVTVSGIDRSRQIPNTKKSRDKWAMPLVKQMAALIVSG